jgi:hexosaminidase
MPLAIVPEPARLELKSGVFRLTESSSILLDATDPTGELLAARLRRSTGFPFPVSTNLPTKEGRGAIILSRSSSGLQLGPEGYRLEVTPEKISVRANSSAGLFYGAQSVLQLFPPEIFSDAVVHRREWLAPCVRIEDRPRFRWRGFMLDVSRHFFSPQEIKTVLDAMALHKLNTFHWHLTDDQGWRIEIKKYPELTSIGAWRSRIGFNLDPKSSTAYDPQGRYGGYYSQSEIRDIIAYAQARQITIVPEIDLPGHSTAALAAYPQFSCSGAPYSTDMNQDTRPGVFCPGKNETFEFLQDVLSEVIDLFPGPFVHVGGDEVPKQNWRHCPACQQRISQNGLVDEHGLQGYFMDRIEKFLDAHGKRMVGWSEIRNEHLAPSTVLMDWIGGATEAVRSGHDVVMSPEEYCYLDFYQAKDRSTEPAAAGAYLPLQKVYSFEPVPDKFDAKQAEHILGPQANLWTEYIPSLGQLEYMAFPRLSALAEVAWSKQNARDWEDFNRRMEAQEQRLKQLHISYRP